MAEINHHVNLSWRSKSFKLSAILLIFGLVLLYGIIPNIHSMFGLELHLRLPSQPRYLIASTLIFYANFLLASTSYKFLAIKKLKFMHILLVELSSAPLGLLFPAGIGGISINYLFLRSKQISHTASGLIVALNNTLGILGNLSLLALLVVIFGINSKLLNLFVQHKDIFTLVLLGFVLILMFLILFLNSNHVFAQRMKRNLLAAFNYYRYSNQWLRLIGAYSCAVAQALVTALAFWLALKAFDVYLSYPLAFLIYSLSVLVGGFIPTPGGLGGVEASLVTSIVALHGANTSLALSAVLGYRAISYWLPAATGSLALYFVRKMRLVKFS